MVSAEAPRGDANVPVDTDKIVGGSKLLAAMRDRIRRKHYSIRTEQAYLAWAKRYILFHAYSDESCHRFRCESCHLFHAKPATYSRGRLPSVGAKRRGNWHCYSDGVVVVNFV